MNHPVPTLVTHFPVHLYQPGIYKTACARIVLTPRRISLSPTCSQCQAKGKCP